MTLTKLPHGINTLIFLSPFFKWGNRLREVMPHSRERQNWDSDKRSKIPKFVLFPVCCTFSRRRQWHPTPVLLPGKSHGCRSLEGCSPWGREESDMTERLHFHFSLSCIGEGNGTPLQCSCLENPRDGRAWWAAIYGDAQSRTRLKRLSSSSSVFSPV